MSVTVECSGCAILRAEVARLRALIACAVEPLVHRAAEVCPRCILESALATLRGDEDEASGTPPDPTWEGEKQGDYDGDDCDFGTTVTKKC